MQRRKRKPAAPPINTYHFEQSRKSITDVIDQMQGKPLEKVLFQIRRSFPFGDRKGQPYKIWNKEVLLAEKLLLEGKEYPPHYEDLEQECFCRVCTDEKLQTNRVQLEDGEG